MKKIIILSALIIFSANLQVFSACPIDAIGACKADIGSGINNRLQDKIIPNNIEKIKQPKNTFENRSQLGQPQIPEQINMEPHQEQINQPYDANCQFGNCMNRTNSGAGKNTK